MAKKVRQSSRPSNAEAALLRELFDEWRLSTEVVPRTDIKRYVEDLTDVLFFDLPNPDQAVRVCEYLLPLWDMADNFGLKLNHPKLARRLEKRRGPVVAGRYRTAVGLWQEKVRAERRSKPN